MHIRTAATVILALALVACSESTTAPAPSQPAVQSQIAPTSPPLKLSLTATSTLDQTALNAEINSLIDQVYTVPVIRSYVHAAWNWAVSQLAQCPPSTDTLKVQAYLNQLVTFMQGAAPRSAAKWALLTQLVTDMSAYVNQAIAGCTV